MNNYQAALDLLLLYKSDPTKIEVEEKFLKKTVWLHVMQELKNVRNMVLKAQDVHLNSQNVSIFMQVFLYLHFVLKKILILSKNTLFCFYKWAKYYNKH